jgi:hypothetical protein
MRLPRRYAPRNDYFVWPFTIILIFPSGLVPRRLRRMENNFRSDTPLLAAG